MTDLVAEARRFATEAHRRIQHQRKYSGQPYEVHLKAVAAIVAEVTDDPEMIAAAWLHDTVEDTPATFEDIERAFGPPVASLVRELTDVSRAGDGNRAARKAIDRAHLAAASARAQTVKLADLIDNCRDICRNDERFARVFLGEAVALLQVLELGDARLRERARRVFEQCAARLGLVPGQYLAAVSPELPGAPDTGLQGRRALRVFAAAFTARDIAEPLRAFDAGEDAVTLGARMAALGLAVAGLRVDGEPRGYLWRDPVAGEAGGALVREFAPGQVVNGDAPLWEVVAVLTRHHVCFVTAFGEVAGVIGRGDMLKPVVRMWLFGIVTMLELNLVDQIRARWPDGGWEEGVSSSRLDKARDLQAERLRRGQSADLLDCLQLGDKAQVLLRDGSFLEAYGFATRSAAKRVVRELESLRNNLAHGQDIVTHDWPQIARLARRIGEAANPA
jgi:hypothetical protein